MNFLMFFFALCSIMLYVAAPDTKKKSYDPLPILYYPLEKRYELSSVDIVERMIAESKLDRLPFSLILLFCYQKAQPGTTGISIKKIVAANEHEFSLRPSCSDDYKPNLFYFSNGFFYSVGYQDIDDIESSLMTYNFQVAVFPRISGPDKSVFIVIWIDREYKGKNTYHTLHRFNVYQRSLVPKETCADYDIQIREETLLNKGDIKEFYYPKNQKKLFNELDIVDINNSFVMHQMAPIDDFIERSRRMAACSTFNITPIWDVVSKGPIKKVEGFIQKVAEHLYPGTLVVNTITRDILQLTNINNEKEKVYLDYEYNQIPVPKYFIKLISYEIPFTPISKTPVLGVFIIPVHTIIVVVHNELITEPELNERICNKAGKNICKTYGWEGVLEKENENGSVYCCERNDPDLKADKVIFNKDSYEPFNLHKVVTYKTKNENLETSIWEKLYNTSTVEEKTAIGEDSPLISIDS